MSDAISPEARKPKTKLRRNTPQRRIILEELCAVTTHPTAAELYILVRRRAPRVSLGTVYRNLEVLHQDGMINKLELAGAETRFDGDLSEHDHVRCSECGNLEDVFGLETNNKPAQPAELAGYQISGYRLEYIGVCPDCQSEADNDATNKTAAAIN